jgi:hypothetical protein
MRVQVQCDADAVMRVQQAVRLQADARRRDVPALCITPQLAKLNQWQPLCAHA